MTKHFSIADFQADPHLHPKWVKQVELEMEMMEQGVERFRASARKARTEGKETSLPHVQRLLRQFIEPVAEEIDFFLKASKKKRGAKHIATKYLPLIEHEISAYLGLKGLMDGISFGQMWVQRLAPKIGRSVMAEVKLGLWAKHHPDIWTAYQRRLDVDHATTDHRKKVLRHGFNKHIAEKLDWADWPDQDLLHLGMKILELICKGTKRFEMRQEAGQYWVVRVLPETAEWLARAMARQELLYPVYLPCVVPPKYWTGPRSGGYHTGVVPMPHGVVRYSGMTRAMLAEAETTLKRADMAHVYKALNALGDTGWRINERVLQVAEHFWRIEAPLADGKALPPKGKIPIPDKPEDIATNEEARKKWKGLAKQAHTKNAALTQKRLNVEGLLTIARRFAPEEALYFPHHCDFRGRIYAGAHSQGLNPQGVDLAKGLLEFSEGVPLTDPRHVGWLAIHLANCWGHNKVSLEDRIAWVEENERDILRWAADPLGDTGWAQADGGEGAWTFLAACMDWAGYVEHGLGYVSHLPIRVDGTCNGLQHLSALLRDEVGGREVNLTSSEKPQDIYRTVADKVTIRLKQIAEGYDRRAELSRMWLKIAEGAIPRSLTKRSVMILPYGGTMLACRQYIEEWLDEADPLAVQFDRERREVPGKKEGEVKVTHTRSEALTLITDLVWTAIKETVTSAEVAFKFIKGAAKAAAASEKPLVWETPSGFPVYHFYAHHPVKEVRVATEQTDIKLRVPSPSDKIELADQLSGIAPNFVHSMDAAACHLFLAYSRDAGITSLTTIHDSYGTHAGKMDAVEQILREAFVGMYEEYSPLEEFREACLKVLAGNEEGRKAVPPVPPMGKLNIREVLASAYFFH